MGETAKIIDLNTYQIKEDKYIPTLNILIGPPCSGKSSYVKRNMRLNTYRVNQDDIRNMIKSGNYKFSNFAEKLINDINIQSVHILLNKGCNVILDNTHCNTKTLDRVQKEFEDKADIKYFIFEVPLWKLKVRNILRYIKKRIWIPIHVIVNMHEKVDFIKEVLRSQGYEYSIIKN